MAYFPVFSNAYKQSLYQVPLLRTFRWNLHNSVWLLWRGLREEGILHFPLPSRHSFPCCWLWVCRHTTSFHCISCLGQNWYNRFQKIECKQSPSLLHISTIEYNGNGTFFSHQSRPDMIQPFLFTAKKVLDIALAYFPSVMVRFDPTIL